MREVIKLFAIIFCLFSSSAYAADSQNAASPATPPQSPGEAEYKMCGKYYLGQGVPKNDVEAYAQCLAGAQKGNPNAMYNLGLFYEKGEGIGQNYNEAEKWFKAGADKGQSDAKYNLKQLELAKKGGMGVTAAAAKEPSAEKPKEAVAAGAIDLAQYCQMAAARGNPDPKCPVELAAQNQAPQKSPNNVLENYIAKAKSGDPQAQNDLGVVYRRGLNGAKKNPQEAQKLFENAASKGSTNGMMNLASMYKDGDVQQNLELAYAWYNLASERAPISSPKRLKAQQNVKEVSKYLNNQQISNALQYAGKLDEKIPVVKEDAPTADNVAAAPAQSKQ